MHRRDFITLLGGAAAWPVAAKAQQLPVVAFVSSRSPEDSTRYGAAFRKALGEAGVLEGQNATVEYHWLDGRYDQLPSLMGEFVRRRVSIIVTPGSSPAAIAAKAATTTIPIVFGMSEDPSQAGLVASLARPGGNATGVNFFNAEVAAKRLGLLHDMVPRARRIALLVNPGNAVVTEPTLRDIPEAARSLGMEIRVLKASNNREIDQAFAALAGESAEALFVANEGAFVSRRVQFAILATRYAIPASYSNRDYIEAGGLMSYGTNIADMYHQVGVYAGRILKGAKPAELPVIQSTKFELVINMAAARALNLTVPGDLLSIADEVIE
jgi:putative ABC transport system substrate-binding protein